MELEVQHSLEFWDDIGCGCKTLGLSQSDAPLTEPLQAVRRQPKFDQTLQPTADVVVLAHKGSNANGLTDADFSCLTSTRGALSRSIGIAVLSFWHQTKSKNRTTSNRPWEIRCLPAVPGLS